MDLNELADELESLRPDDVNDDWGFRLTAAMFGKVSEIIMRTDHIADSMDEAVEKTGMDAETIEEASEGAKQETIGALFVAVAELAAQEDVDLEAAVESRVETMKKSREMKERVQKWDDAGLLDEQGSVDTDLSAEDDRTYF